MKKIEKIILIVFGTCLSLTVYTGLNLSFDSHNSNSIFLIIFLITFFFTMYSVVFVNVIYHKKISQYTIQKIKTKIEKTIECTNGRWCVVNQGDLAAAISFLSVSIIATNSPETFLSLLPADEFFQPIFNNVIQNTNSTSIDTPRFSIPYISSTKFLMLAAIGPMVVFILKLARYLEIQKIEKLPKKERKQSEQDRDNNVFPGVRVLIIFLLVSPCVLIITRITTPNFIVFDFTLLAAAMLSILSWICVWFIDLTERALFSKLLK